MRIVTAPLNEVTEPNDYRKEESAEENTTTLLIILSLAFLATALVLLSIVIPDALSISFFLGKHGSRSIARLLQFLEFGLFKMNSLC